MLSKKLLLLFSITPSFLLAQQNDTTQLKEVIIQENRLLIPFDQRNRNIQIINQEEIQALPSTSINEVLRYAAGVDIRQRGPFGTQADIGIDGGSFDQTLILINGVKLSDPQTGHHMLNLPVPLSEIQRIEILRGPVSRIYGINGLTGAVNIVTKQAESNSVFVQVNGGSSFKKVEEEAGKDGIYYANAVQVGGSFVRKTHQHQLYFGKEHSNGQRYNSGADNEKLYYQNQISIAPDHRIQMMAGYINNEFGANGYYAAPGDKESEELVETVISSISSHHQLNKWYLSPRISHRYNEDDYRYFRHDLSKGRSKHYTQTLSTELHARYQTALGDLGIGAEARFEDISSSNIGKHSRENYGFFTEFRTTKFDRFDINVGAYVNYNSDYDWEVFPGIDIGFQATENLRLSVNSGTSQRIPTFTDLYLNQRPGNIGNPDLKSESAWQNEIGLQYSQNKWSFQAGYFYRDISRFIDWLRESTDVPYQAQNLGNNKTHGVYSNLGYKTAFGTDQHMTVNLAYTYLNPSIINDYKNTIIKYGIESLRHQAQATVSYAFRTWSITSANRWLERSSSNSYFVSDLRLAYSKKSISIFADIQNIFDEKYIEVGAVPMPTRWANLGLRYQWVQR